MILREDRWTSSRSQVAYCYEHGLIEFIQLSPLQPSVEDLAYIAAGYPKLDVILFIDHRVLDECELEVRHHRVMKSIPLAYSGGY